MSTLRSVTETLQWNETVTAQRKRYTVTKPLQCHEKVSVTKRLQLFTKKTFTKKTQKKYRTMNHSTILQPISVEDPSTPGGEPPSHRVWKTSQPRSGYLRTLVDEKSWLTQHQVVTNPTSLGLPIPVHSGCWGSASPRWSDGCHSFSKPNPHLEIAHALGNRQRRVVQRRVRRVGRRRTPHEGTHRMARQVIATV